MSARDDYPDLPEGSGLEDWERQWEAMCGEIDRLRALADDYDEGYTLNMVPGATGEFTTDEQLDYAVGDVITVNLNGEVTSNRIIDITPTETGMYRYSLAAVWDLPSPGASRPVPPAHRGRGGPGQQRKESGMDIAAIKQQLADEIRKTMPDLHVYDGHLERSTADIVKDLREWEDLDDELVHGEAADRLEALQAELDYLNEQLAAIK